jgi:aryl-alcohol dehydrogenase-like predicted oxidoreductase
MEFRQLGHLHVSSVGLGTYKTFDVTSEPDIAIRHEIIHACVTHRVTFIDSSPMYGHSEEIIGHTTVGKREHFHLATKVWCQGRSQGETQIARSFTRLRTDYIDVLQIHNLVDWQTHLLTLERLKEEGKIGLIGITHYATSAYPAMMQIMRSGRIDTVQIPYNVLRTRMRGQDVAAREGSVCYRTAPPA